MPTEENTNQLEIWTHPSSDESQNEACDHRNIRSSLDREDEDPERWDGMS